jgi:hypothetical protein
MGTGLSWSDPEFQVFGPGDIDYRALAEMLQQAEVRPHIVLEQAVECAFLPAPRNASQSRNQRGLTTVARPDGSPRLRSRSRQRA